MLTCLLQVPLLVSLAATTILPPPISLLGPEVVVATTTSTTSTENYLPRLLYPATYKNYCGPTPEITAVHNNDNGPPCTAHGWHGDEALDIVDEACRIHDVSYCSCEVQMLSRQHKPEQIPGLSSLIALRFLTLPALVSTGLIDDEYLNCIHQADVKLITTGITIRHEQQQSNCGESLSSSSTSLSSSSENVDDDSSNNNNNNKLKWFCQLEEGSILSAFEKVSLAIFLRNLDLDQQQQQQQQQHEQQSTALPKVHANINNKNNNHPNMLLTQLESKRQEHFMSELKKGKTIAAAMASPIVQQDEHEMLQLLQQ